MSAVAIIPVRGGSRGIPGKNIRPMAGRPLLHWTLRAAVACPRIDAVYVSTDDAAIAAVAGEMPGVRVIPRAPETATDTASTESVLFDAFGRIGDHDDVMLIQATSPLLTAADLDAGFRERDRLGADSALSVVRQKRFVWKRGADGIATPQNYDPARRPRRQEFDGLLVENGAFYLARRRDIVSARHRLPGRVAAVEMHPDSYVEIDEPSDWDMVAALVDEARKRRLAGIRLVACDVDGTLTDGGMYYGADGEALKKFNTRDAAGLRALKERWNVEVAIITGEDSPAVRARCAKLGYGLAAHGCADKVATLRAWCGRLGITLEQVAFIGDDLGDLAALRVAGYSACPADAAAECAAAADVRLRARGGRGCVREFADLIAAAKAAHPEHAAARPTTLDAKVTP